MADLVFGVAGAVVGSFFGFPAIGFSIGAYIGNSFKKLPDQEGPRLKDLRVTTSSVGTAIPIVYGSGRVAGQIIWSSGIKETKHEEDVGGKGGPSQEVTTYTYSASFACALAEGEQKGIVRIWANGALIFDVRPQFSGESDNDYEKRQAKAQLLIDKMTFYEGSDTQVADSLIEGFMGSGNVPAFRGLSYVVFDDLQLAKYGNRIPNLEFELGPTEDSIQEVLDYWRLHPWSYKTDTTGCDPWETCIPPEAARPIPSPCNEHEYFTHKGAGPFSTIAETHAASGNEVVYDWSTSQLNPISKDFRETNSQSDSLDYEWIYYRTNWANSLGGGSSQCLYPPTNLSGDPCAQFIDCSQKRYYAKSLSTFGAVGLRRCDICFTLGPAEDCEQSKVINKWKGQENFDSRYKASVCINHQELVLYRLDQNFTLRRKPSPPLDPCSICGCTTGPYPDLPENPEEYCVLPSGLIQRKRNWTEINEVGGFKVLSKYTVDSGGLGSDDNIVKTYPIGPVLRAGDSDDTQTFWENAYSEALSLAQSADPPFFIPDDWVYGVDYPVTVDSVFQDFGDVRTGEPDPIPLKDIVDDILDRSGVEAACYDTSGLTGQVLGYMVPKPMSGRAALEQLAAIFDFYGVESDGVLKFAHKSGTSIESIPEDVLDAVPDGSEPKFHMKTIRQQELELPQRVRVHYLDYNNGYQVGTQYAERVVTDTKNVSDIEFAIVMTASQAAQAADRILSQLWVGRNTYELDVPRDFMKIDPGDVVDVTAPTVSGIQNAIMRIGETDWQGNGIIRWKGIADSPASYESNAVGEEAGDIGDISDISGPTAVDLYDIPALDSDGDNPGFYFGLHGFFDEWQGGVLQRSVDEGSSWNTISSSSVSKVYGTTTTTLAPSSPFVIDQGSTVTVELPKSDMSLSSTTDTLLLEGANLCAIGDDDRWEVLQFRDATNTSGNLWKLSHLIRGRFGTEVHMNSHTIADRFVLLDNAVVRYNGVLGAIGQERLYRGVSFNQSGQTAQQLTFTPEGEALKPYAPVHVSAKRTDDTTILISWERRSRFEGDWADFFDVPLNEDEEKYEIDVYDETDAIIDTVTATSADEKSIEYPVTISTSTSYSFIVYQIGKIGRGHPSEKVSSDTYSWTPDRLFLTNDGIPNGAFGGWYEADDLTRLWQDDAMTVPALVGSPVAVMEDKTNQGRHFIQNDPAERPFLRQDVNGNYYLEADGTKNMFISSSGHYFKFIRGRKSTNSGGAASGGFLSAAVQFGESSNPDDGIYTLIGNGIWDADHEAFQIGWDDRSSQGRNNAIRAMAGGNSNFLPFYDYAIDNVLVPNVPKLMTMNYDWNSASPTTESFEINTYVDGSLVDQRDHSDTPIDTGAPFSVHLFSPGNTANQMVGRFYGMILLERTLDVTIRDLVEEYLAAKADITLL